MILICGAAGTCGSALVAEFERRGRAARALIRSQRRAAALPGLSSVRLVEGDMADSRTLGPALEGVTTAFLASTSDIRMTETQCRFIDAAKAAGVERIVKLSGAESGIGFDASKFRFTRMHEEIERYLEASGVAWTHLRPSQFMQVYLREATTIARSGELRLPLRDVALSPIDVRDIAGVAYETLADGVHRGMRYEMTGPEALTMEMVAATIARVTRRSVRYVAISFAERRAALLAAGAPAVFADAMQEQNDERLNHPLSRVDVGAQARCGVTPTTFEAFVARHRGAFTPE